MGMAGATIPMMDLLFPCRLVVGGARGSETEGKGTGTFIDVRVIADGVCVVSVGEGGKTKRV